MFAEINLTRYLGALAVLAGLAGWILTSPAPARDPYGSLPLSFEANAGQAGGDVQFVARGRGYTLLLNAGGAELATPDTVLRMRMPGANASPSAQGEEELPGRSHYLVGGDARQWRTNIPHYGRVRYREMYPGIDLVYYGRSGQLEYDFVVSPGADPRSIRLLFDGDADLALKANGDLAVGSVRIHKPVAYQNFGRLRRRVPARYIMEGKNQAVFDVRGYDPSLPLVIDPVVSYSTYLGGAGGEHAAAIAVDSAGSAYITGSTTSPNFPTVKSRQPALATQSCEVAPSSFACMDAFVVKLNPAGTALVYATYLGGTLEDTGQGIAVDAAGNAYITGSTASADFPTSGALQPAFGGGGAGTGETDAFVAKLNPTGEALVFSTYLGGNHSDRAADIAIDSAGNVYVAGETHSPNFPLTNLLPEAAGANGYAFIAKLNAAASALTYSTAVAPANWSFPVFGLAVDDAGNAYITGSGLLVAKLNAAGTALVYSTYLGGSAFSWGADIAVDSAGNAYVTGSTWPFRGGTNIPTTPGAFQPAPGAVCRGDFDCVSNAFVAKLNPAGAPVYTTYLSGFGDQIGHWDAARSIAVDREGNAWVAGKGRIPQVNPLQRDPGGAFVAKFNPAGSGLLFATSLGGMEGSASLAIAVDRLGAAYVAGYAQANFPTTAGAIQRQYGGSFSNGWVFGDAFVGKITVEAPANPLPAVTTILPSRAVVGAGEVRLVVNGSGFVPASVVRWNGEDRPTTFSNATRLEALIPASDFSRPAWRQVAAYTPDGGLSNSIPFLIGLPTINRGGIVNAASFQPVVAPGSIVAIFGTEFGEVLIPTYGWSSFTVTLNRLPVLVFFADNTRIIVQLPFTVAPGTATVEVLRDILTSAGETVRVAAVAPGIFAVNGQGHGPGAILRASDQRLVSQGSPVEPGEFISIYCTGLGVLRGPLETVSRPDVFIGDVPARVTYSGLAPGFAGLNQVNAQVPAIPAGDHSVRIVIDGVSSNTVTLAVR